MNFSIPAITLRLGLKRRAGTMDEEFLAINSVDEGVFEIYGMLKILFGRMTV